MIDADAAESPDPDLAGLRRAEQCRDPVVGKCRLHVACEDVEAYTVEAREALLGTDPEETVRILRESRNRALRKPLHLPPGAERILVEGGRRLGAARGRDREREHKRDQAAAKPGKRPPA